MRVYFEIIGQTESVMQVSVEWRLKDLYDYTVQYIIAADIADLNGAIIHLKNTGDTAAVVDAIAGIIEATKDFALSPGVDTEEMRRRTKALIGEIYAEDHRIRKAVEQDGTIDRTLLPD